jgi:uncharacterized protein (TIRG00374 family)
VALLARGRPILHRAGSIRPPVGFLDYVFLDDGPDHKLEDDRTGIPEEGGPQLGRVGEARSGGKGGGRWWKVVLSLAVVAAVFFFALPKFADLGDVWMAIKDLTPVEIGTLLALALWNIATYWFVMVASLPGSNYWQAMKINQASTAISNTLPGGSALGVAVTYAMYSASGFSRSEVGLSVIVSGLWNNFVKLGMPIVALALLAIGGSASGGLVSASMIGLATLVTALVLFALSLRSERYARKVGARLAGGMSALRRVFRKPPVGDWAESMARFRADALGLLRKRWLHLTFATLLSHLTLFSVLLLSLRHVGVTEAQVGTVEALAAFAFVRLISALPITPGGIGVVELGLTAALVAAGGPEAPVVAAVLVYRILTYFLPIPIGLVMYLRWARGAEARKVRAEQMRAARTPVAPVP